MDMKEDNTSTHMASICCNDMHNVAKEEGPDLLDSFRSPAGWLFFGGIGIECVGGGEGQYIDD